MGRTATVSISVCGHAGSHRSPPHRRRALIARATRSMAGTASHRTALHCASCMHAARGCGCRRRRHAAACKHVTPRRIIPPYLRSGVRWPGRWWWRPVRTCMQVCALLPAAHRRRLRYACVGRCGSGTTDPAGLLL
jgi:hypothetical protein